MGCEEISLGDTIGVGTPKQISNLVHQLEKQGVIKKIALHCHDTYGMALANIYAALQCGVTTFDTSIAGLGGCPYAPGAGGNVATEDVVYLLHGLGFETGIDLDALIAVDQFICQRLSHTTRSKVAQALGLG